MSLKLMLQLANMADEDQLLMEIERAVRALRQNKTKERHEEVKSLCMLYAMKHAVKGENIDTFCADTERVKKLDRMFKNQSN